MLRRRDGGPEHDSPPSDTDRATVWACFLAGEMPDLDMFLGSGPMDQYVYHRGFTHSLTAAPLIALLAAGLVKLIWRQARVGTVFLWSLAAVLLGHLATDWITGWGTRLLLPFSDRRLGLDWVPIIDLFFTLPLLAAVLLAWRRPRLRRRLMAGVLAYLAVYVVGYRGLSHTLVEQAVAAAYRGQPVARLQVSPDLFNPLAWRFAVDLGDRYEQGLAYPFGAVAADRTVAKLPDGDPVVQMVRAAPELRPFFDQFAFVQIAYEKIGPGYEVTLSDVRYNVGGRSFAYRVELSATGQVVRISGGW